MNTDLLLKDSRLTYGDLTHQIIGSAMDVINSIGHGFPEKVYENSLVQDFLLKDIRVDQQRSFDIHYREKVVGTFIPDLIINDTIIVDTKCIEKITDRELGQMLNYLKITTLKIGLIMNFKRAKLEWERVIR